MYIIYLYISYINHVISQFIGLLLRYIKIFNKMLLLNERNTIRNKTKQKKKKSHILLL